MPETPSTFPNPEDRARSLRLILSYVEQDPIHSSSVLHEMRTDPRGLNEAATALIAVFTLWIGQELLVSGKPSTYVADEIRRKLHQLAAQIAASDSPNDRIPRVESTEREWPTEQ